MAKKDERKARKQKERKEAVRKQKAQVVAQPRLLRQHPGLTEALSRRNLLVGYYVNNDWQEAREASVVVIREAETGQVSAVFLIDLMGYGMKDVFGNYGSIDALGELQADLQQGPGHVELVPLDPATAVNIIRGGVAWSRCFHFPLPPELDLWLRLVDPAPADGLDLTMFGDEEGKPEIVPDINDLLALLPEDISDEEIDELLDEMVEATDEDTNTNKEL